MGDTKECKCERTLVEDQGGVCARCHGWVLDESTTPEGLSAVEIGTETWYYSVGGMYTRVYDEDVQLAFYLPFLAAAGEVKAAAYGYGRGFQRGKAVGSAEKVEAIRQALGLAN